jgi:hypothetical protein
MNREVTSNLWPLTGDVSTEAGSTSVTVTGINSIPVEAVTMQGGEAIVFDPNVASWTPRLQAVIQVNNVTISDDPYVSVNVVKPILVNGA